MKKITFLFTFTVFTAVGLKAQSLQYFMQRSSVNIASMSEVQNLQMFFSGAQSLAGFEGAPKNITFDIASPIQMASRGFHPRSTDNAQNRNFVGGTVQHESFGVHTYFRATLGYNYRLTVDDNSSLTFGIAGGLRNRNSDYGRLNDDATVYSIKETSFVYRLGARYESENFSVSVFNNSKDYVGGEIVWNQLWNNPSIRSNRSDGGFGGEGAKSWAMQIAALLHRNVEMKTSVMRFSANIVYNESFGAGISYQTDNDLSANVSLRLTRQLRIGYAYQFMHFNPMAKKHEVVARYQLARNSN